MQAQNSNQMFESMLACFRLGAVWVPTNFRQSPDEVAFLAQSSGAQVMICGAEFPDHAAACTGIRHHLTIGGGGDDFEALIAEHMGETVANQAVDHSDPCWFFFTSGTTGGRPKAAVLTHGQMAFVLVNHLNDLMPGTGARDASLVVAPPLSHGAGIHQLVNLAAGSTTVLMPQGKFEVDTAWKLIEAHRITNLFTVPTIVKMLVEDPAVDRYDRSSLRYMIYAGAPMYRADQKVALERLGPVLVQYLGWVRSRGISPCCPLLSITLTTHRCVWGVAAMSARGWKFPFRPRTGPSLGPIRPARFASVGPPCSRVITTTPRPMRNPSAMAGSAPAISAIWMRRAISISRGAHQICISRADPTSIPARLKRKC